MCHRYEPKSPGLQKSAYYLSRLDQTRTGCESTGTNHGVELAQVVLNRSSRQDDPAGRAEGLEHRSGFVVCRF
jgi:hypothetical protein